MKDGLSSKDLSKSLSAILKRPVVLHQGGRKGRFKGCYSTPSFFVASPMAYYNLLLLLLFGLFKSVPVDLCTTYPLLQAV